MFELSWMNIAMQRFSFTIAACLAVVLTGAITAFSQTASGTFVDFVSKRLLTDEKRATGQQASSKPDITNFCNVDKSVVARRIFIEYGAMFVASNEVTLPPLCLFPDEKTTQLFQSRLTIKAAPIDGSEIRLQ